MSYFFARTKNRLYNLLYTNFLNRYGFGGRVSKEIWERQYAGDTWDYLYSADEEAHYKAIIGQIILLKSASSSILDIGCGHGVFYNYLIKSFQSRLKYTGIDISENAIHKATETFPGAGFSVKDYDYDDVSGKFDVVVFNETLYYFIKPMKTLEKVAIENLEKGGIIIVSMCEDEKHDLIWKKIHSSFQVRKEETVENSKGQRWKIKSLSPLI